MSPQKSNSNTLNFKRIYKFDIVKEFK